MRRKEERTGSIWQKADTNFQNQLGCPSATDSEFYMGLAGKQSKWRKQETRTGNQDSTWAAELEGCAAITEESFLKECSVGFSAWSLMCSHDALLLLLLFPLDSLIQHTEENTVLREQDGAATGRGSGLCPGLWAYCEGPHFIPPGFGGLVLR